jgi:hypothetical protein
LQVAGPSGPRLSPGRVQNFHFLISPTYPPTKWVQGAMSPGVTRPERDDVNSYAISAKSKQIVALHSLPPPLRLHGVVLTVVLLQGQKAIPHCVR